MAETSVVSNVSPGPHRLLRYLFFLIVVRPVMLIILGMNVRHRERLPLQGPAIIIANHNSHLDALALITLFGMNRLHRIRPVAAADYFLASKPWAWFSLRILGIIPLDREVRSHRQHPLQPICDSLEAGEIVLLFPEGTRGKPEQRSEFQAGVAHLAKRFSEIPIVPVFVHGLGKALPRGEALLVPFICDMFIGNRVHWTGDKTTFLAELCTAFDHLETEASKPPYLDHDC